MPQFAKRLLAAAVLVVAPSLALAASADYGNQARGTNAALHSYHAARLARL